MNNTGGASDSALRKTAGAAAKQLKKDVDLLNKSLQQTGKAGSDSSKKIANSFNGLRASITGINQGLQLTQTLMRGVQKMANFSDQQTAIQSRLSLMTGSPEGAEQMRQGIMAVANRSRGDYTSTANMVSQLGILAGEAFSDAEGNLNQNELLAFAESVNKSFVISGTAGTVGADAAMLQLQQAMSSGRLNGDELRSIMEQAPLIAQTVAKYMGVSVGELREIAGEGQVTADIVKAAMIGSLDEINEKYKDMPVTFGQAMTMLKNDALEAAQPLIKGFSDFINSDLFQGFLETASQAFTRMVEFAQKIIGIFSKLENSPGMTAFISDLNRIIGIMAFMIELIATVVSWVLDNWNIIGPILYGILTVLGLIYGGLALIAGIYSVVNTLQTIWNALSLANPTLLIIMGIILGLIALVSIFFVVIAVINNVTGSSISALGMLAGAAWTVGATFKNVGLLFANIGLGIAAVVVALTHNIGVAFSNAWRGVKIGFWSFVDVLMQGFKDIGEFANRTLGWMGVDIDTSGLDFAKSKIAEIGAKRDDYQNVGDAWNEAFNTFQVFEDGWAAKAYDAGYAKGEGAQKSVEEALAGFNLTGLTSDAEYFADKQKDLTDAATGDGINIKDEVEISDEDIKMMKDIAAVEWVNKFTTLRPEMTVTFGDVHETADTEKILETIETMVEEAYASALVGG